MMWVAWKRHEYTNTKGSSHWHKKVLKRPKVPEASDRVTQDNGLSDVSECR
jgi:hypothetical protein